MRLSSLELVAVLSLCDQDLGCPEAATGLRKLVQLYFDSLQAPATPKPREMSELEPRTEPRGLGL